MTTSRRVNFRANRRSPSIASVSGDPASHTVALRAMKEAIELHERRTPDYLHSFVRLHELVDVGLITLHGDKFNTIGENIALLDRENTFTENVIVTGSISASGVITAPLGSAAAPSFAFSPGDMGMYRSAATVLGWATEGAVRMRLNSNGLLIDTGAVRITERAAAVNDAAGVGQLWVKNTTPCELWFTDDAGTDTQIV